MIGALLVTLIAFRRTATRVKPWFDTQFHLPQSTVIDTRLLAGAALFGAGWGLAGYCPGPALATSLVGGSAVGTFVLAMLAGMWWCKK
jgi:uncharacterized membrane protein YedE/YeeE